MSSPPIPPLVPAGGTFNFGESPFQVKGVLYRGTRSFFEKAVPGGYGRLLDALDPPPLRAFMERKFLASRLYDVMPVPALIAYEARTLGQSFEDYLLGRTRWQAEQDIGGVYRLLLRVATPGLVVSRLPWVLAQMFAFPTVELSRPSEGVADATFHNIPQPLEPWLSIGFSVYTRTAMEAVGVRSVDVNFTSSASEGTEAGLDMLSLRMRVTWS